MDTALQVTEEPKPLTVLGSERPADIVARATEVANVLAPIIEQKGLFSSISGKRHVKAEGWATLMGLLNVDPIVEYCRRVDRPGEIAYESRVLLVKNGVTISAAETIASDAEKASWSRSEQGVKSMAQTRAFGKACRLKFSWIVVLAGYAPTPAEEFDDERPTIQGPKTKSESRPEIPFGNLPNPGEKLFPDKKVISEKQRKMIFAKCRAANIPDNVFRAYIKSNWLTEHTSELPWQSMDAIIKWIDAYKNLDA